MFSSDISGSFINDFFRTENSTSSASSTSTSSDSSSKETSSTDKAFQKNLQNKLEEQKTETFREKENEKVSYAFEVPTKPQQTQEIKGPGLNNEENLTFANKILAKNPSIPTKNVTQKEEIPTTNLEAILKKLTVLLQKLGDEKIEPTDELNALLASLATLLEQLSINPDTPPEQNQLEDIASRIKQIQLTNPRTKENIPINFISKKDLAELLNKITNETNHHPAQETQEITTKISELLEKLSGVIESSKNNTQVISQTIPIDPPKVDDKISTPKDDNKPTKLATEPLKVEAKDSKNTEATLSENESSTKDLFEKKQIDPKIKNEESLFNQNNKFENKIVPEKMLSLDNDMPEFSAKAPVADIKAPEIMPLVKTTSTDLERQNQIINQFRTYLTINKLKADTEVTMRLYPKELGEINIKITKEQIAGSENTQIVAKFQVSSAAVKAILESNFDSLKNDLQQNSNILVSALSVEINDKENKSKNFSDLYEKTGTPKKFKTTEIITDKNNLVEPILDKNEINSLA